MGTAISKIQHNDSIQGSLLEEMISFDQKPRKSMMTFSAFSSIWKFSNKRHSHKIARQDRTNPFMTGFDLTQSIPTVFSQKRIMVDPGNSPVYPCLGDLEKVQWPWPFGHFTTNAKTNLKQNKSFEQSSYCPHVTFGMFFWYGLVFYRAHFPTPPNGILSWPLTFCHSRSNFQLRLG